MQNKKAYTAYKNSDSNKVSKERLLIMLLDGAVSFSQLGRQAILDKDIKKAHENIIKTENIFYELMYYLDINDENDWTSKLYKVYEYIVYKLVQANLKKDERIMDEIIPFIEEIRDTWKEAYRISKK